MHIAQQYDSQYDVLPHPENPGIELKTPLTQMTETLGQVAGHHEALHLKLAQELTQG